MGLSEPFPFSVLGPFLHLCGPPLPAVLLVFPVFFLKGPVVGFSGAPPPSVMHRLVLKTPDMSVETMAMRCQGHVFGWLFFALLALAVPGSFLFFTRRAFSPMRPPLRRSGLRLPVVLPSHF